MIESNILELHKKLAHQYIEFRLYLDKQDISEIKYSFKDYVDTIFKQDDILNLILEGTDNE